MPSAPKPSQATAAKPKRVRAPRVRKSRAKSPRETPANGALTTKDVAGQLGIGAGRVRSLVKSGRMQLTPDSVREYADSRRTVKKSKAEDEA